MAVWSWWAHEARRCGRQALALPILSALVVYAAVTTGPGEGTLLGRSLLTTALPAAAALACAAVVAGEPMAELHLTLPTSYQRTVARQLALLAAVTSSAAVALVGLLAADGHAPGPGPVVVLAELTGLTVLLGGCAVWATAVSGSAATASGLVVAACLAKLLLVDRVVREGAAQAVPALFAGITLTVLALRVLGDGARLERGEA